MSPRRMETERAGEIATVWLARPEALNALDVRALGELADTVAALDEESDLRVLVLAGRGRAFSAGADRTELETLVSGAGADAAIEAGHRALRVLHDARCVTIAAAHGYAVGGGLSLLLACDLRLATEDCTFFIPEIDLGIPYLWGSTPLLVQAVGAARAKELMLTADRFDAAAALDWGILNRVVPAGTAHEEALALARRIAAKPPAAVAAVKLLARRWRTLEDYDLEEEKRIAHRVLGE